jgi:hypothetical protein
VIGRRAQESRERVRADLYVVIVEHAFGEPAEEPRGAALGDIAARTEKCGAGREHPAERDQAVLVVAGAVQ